MQSAIKINARVLIAWLFIGGVVGGCSGLVAEHRIRNRPVAGSTLSIPPHANLSKVSKERKMDIHRAILLQKL